MYNIRIWYRTGSSFETVDESTILDYDWEDPSTAVRNLKNIKEHYEMNQKLCSGYHAPIKELKEKYGDREWFVYSEDEFVSPEALASNTIYLFLDDGTKFRYSCEWIGYFEELKKGEVIGPSFETDECY